MSGEDKNMSRRDELETLLPFYLNGTLSGEDLRAVEEWLASDAEAMAALAEAEMEFSETGASNETVRPPADALTRFSKALEREAGPARGEFGRPGAGASWFAIAWRRLAGLPAGLAWATAMAAIAVVVLQAVSGGAFRGGYEIAGSEDKTTDKPFVFVVFKPDAEMSAISGFLAEQGATIVGGPTAGGVFRIAIRADDVAEYDRVVGLIAAQPFADKVTPGRKPPDDG